MAMIRAARQQRQRAERGFSDEDAWNGDGRLAFIIASLLTHYANGHIGVNGAFIHEANKDFPRPEVHSPEYEEEALKRGAAYQRAEFERNADVFRRYHEHDVWDDPKDVEQFGGCTQAELDDTLLWFATYFQTLWD